MFKKITMIGLLAFLILLFAAAPASAHNAALIVGDNITDAMEADYNDYLIKEGTTLPILLIHGHGFEYDFGNVSTAVNVTIVSPDGTKKNVTTQTATQEVDKILSGEKDTVTYQKINYNFTQSGTYFLYATLPGETTEIAKLAIFVGDGTWDDWNKQLGLPLEFTMYTRMGGLAEGETVFGRLVYENGTGAENVKYYVEPVKTAAEAKELYDMLVSNYTTGESIYLIYSKRAMTDEAGKFVSAIPEKGVWSFVASADVDGTPYKATYTFPVLPQFYGTADESSNTNNETPGFGIVFAVLAIIGVGAVLFMRRK
ncbi:DUF4198 domain-containing protein [Methanimicrococcus blatticola]|uniref:PGF-CTERM protein n=1 Tax=Methanimicrococcus blatticola TaxID=91560 RepID=A0A484F6Y5_9EURY|nr:DUF4198 domain-containing protein [Methanimicrococcus blatticola]MBZ3936126.1 DUF4198 domain-containing protein [Methanimicrococcus blatticola]MCC2508369.1 DUF4198 domain-containing protein [Methanimicrococcus blatticola]TDQ70178.1 PGF-CTERM protein [Methanimicrococcus blatticola]